MKTFITYNTIRDNGLFLARRMYDEGYVPDVIYTLMRGGAYLGNIISEFYKLANKNKKPILYSAVVAHSYTGVHENTEVILDGWTLDPKTLDKDTSILIVDDIFDSGATVNFLVNDLIKNGIERKNIKIAVHDYKVFHYKPKQYEFQPDYWCKKHELYSEDDKLWIHYLSHELVGLSAAELEDYYFKRNPELKAVFKGIVE